MRINVRPVRLLQFFGVVLSIWLGFRADPVPLRVERVLVLVVFGTFDGPCLVVRDILASVFFPQKKVIQTIKGMLRNEREHGEKKRMWLPTCFETTLGMVRLS